MLTKSNIRNTILVYRCILVYYVCNRAELCRDLCIRMVRSLLTSLLRRAALWSVAGFYSEAASLLVSYLDRRLVSSCLRMPRVPACHELMQSELGFSNPEPVCPFQLWSSETAVYRSPKLTEEFVNFSNFSLIIFGAQKPPMKLSQVYKHSFGLCFTKELSITARGLNEKITQCGQRVDPLAGQVYAARG